MHYLLLTFSLILQYLYRYICILNVVVYVYVHEHSDYICNKEFIIIISRKIKQIQQTNNNNIIHTCKPKYL